MEIRHSGSMVRTGRRLALTLGTALLAAAAPAPIPSVSGPPVPVQSAPVSVPSVSRSSRLAEFIPASGPMDLRGDRGEGGLWFNLSTRVEPTSASLHLELSNSQALMAPRSQFVVRLNDAVVAQIALRPGSPLTVADIDLPPELLRGGSNHLTFTAAQHYTNGCENPAAAELWSQIDTSRSRLTVAARPVALSPHLSDLPELIGPGFFGGHRFTVMAPHAAGDDAVLDENAVQVGAAVAQALGVRLRYQAPSIDVAQARPAVGSDDPLLRLQAPPASGPAGDASDLVLFGTAAELAPVLGSDLARTLARSSGGFLGLYTLPADRTRLVLVVSGSTLADVQRAAAALGVAGFPFVDAAEQTVDALGLPPASGSGALDGAVVSLSDLGFPTVTLRGPANSASFEVPVPADWYVPDSAEAELSLDFAYGAGLRSDAAVNIMLNGQFLQALALPDPGGAVLRSYKVHLPARKLHAGRNTVTFETALTSAVSGACTAGQTRNLVLSVAGTSTFALPRGDRLAAQPDLGLFAATGFPYVGNGATFDLALASGDDATVGAGWTLLARLAQLAGRTMPETNAIVGTPTPGRDALVVGAAPDLSPAMMAAAPVTVGGEVSLPYTSSGLRPAAAASSWTQHLLGLFGMSARADEAAGADQAGVSHIRGRAELGRNGLMTAFQAFGPGEHTVTVLTAAGRPELWRAANAVVSPAVWDRLGADLAVWRPGSDTVATERAGAVFHVGSRSTLYAARYYVGQYPLAWIGALLGSVLLLALVSRMFLARRLHRRFPGSTEGIP